MKQDQPVTLLSCPFCGGEGHVGTIRYSRSPYVDDRCKDQLEYWQVNCSTCCATVRGLAGIPSEVEAITAWNKRTGDQALRDALLSIPTDAMIEAGRAGLRIWAPRVNDDALGLLADAAYRAMVAALSQETDR